MTGSFDWTALTMVLIAVALLFALGAVIYKKVKSSRKLKRKAPKQGKASYHRDNVKYSSKKDDEDADETEEPAEEPAEDSDDQKDE